MSKNVKTLSKYVVVIILTIGLAGCGSGGESGSTSLDLQGSTTVTPIVVEASKQWEKQRDITVRVDSSGGSSGGINAVAQNRVDLGMSSRPISDHDREKYPDVNFETVRTGFDAIAVAVNSTVYEAGVKSLTIEQVQKIFDGDIKNWKELGGPDQSVVVYDKEPGRGTREVFDKTIFGGHHDRPSYGWRSEVGGNDESRMRIANNEGAIGQLSVAWVEEDKNVRAIGLNVDGSVYRPVVSSIKSGDYPLARPLFIVKADQTPTLGTDFIDYLLSEEGQQFVKGNGFLPVREN